MSIIVATAKHLLDKKSEKLSTLVFPVSTSKMVVGFNYSLDYHKIPFKAYLKPLKRKREYTTVLTDLSKKKLKLENIVRLHLEVVAFREGYIRKYIVDYNGEVVIFITVNYYNEDERPNKNSKLVSHLCKKQHIRTSLADLKSREYISV